MNPKNHSPISYFAAFLLNALTLSCGNEPDDSDLKVNQLGATCYSYPILKEPHTSWDRNLCQMPGKTFIPGILALAAQEIAINNCIDLNALDVGHWAGNGASCKAECKKSTRCIPFGSE